MKQPERRELRRAARRFVVGVEGPELAEAEKEILAECPPGGAILFRRNLVSARQTRKLVASIRQAAGKPIFVCIDQEGGRVDRLAAFRKPSPSAESLSARGIAACVRAGQKTARELLALDIDLDLAPVVDLRPADGEGIGFGGRTFGSSAGEVAEHAGAFLHGLQVGGVAGCVKHFPGLGRSTVDSHRSLPVVVASPDEILSTDLAPFAILGDQARAVMISHALFPALDRKLPASLSPAIIRRLLVKELGFEGAIFSDDLEMGALATFGSLADRARLAFLAGTTFLLVCSQISDFPEAALVVAKASSGLRGRGLIEDAEKRDRRFRRAMAAARKRAGVPVRPSVAAGSSRR